MVQLCQMIAYHNLSTTKYKNTIDDDSGNNDCEKVVEIMDGSRFF